MDPRYVRRLPTYVYLQDLFSGRRVLELGCGEGESAHFLLQAGAAEVTGVDRSARAVESGRARFKVAGLELRVGDYAALQLEDRAYDVVCVPSGPEVIRQLGVLEEIRRVLAPDGLLLLQVPSGDRPEAPGGIAYHELGDRLEPLFGAPRMIAITPFVGFSLVEYGDDGGEVLEIDLDTQLASLDGEDPVVTDYVAVAGPARLAARGFTVVQLPVASGLEAGRAAQLGEVAAAAPQRPREQGSERLREAEVVAADALARLREVEAELTSLRRGSGRGEEAELRRRLARAADERAAAEAELVQLRARLGEAEIELGRVAARASIEIGELRNQIEQGAAQLVETEAQLAEARRELVRQELQAAAGGGEAGPRPVAPPGAPTLVPQRAEVEATPASIELLATAAKAHEQELAALRAELDERDAYIEELRGDLAAAELAAGEAGTRARESTARATGLDAELREVRGRMARAEGELLKVRLGGKPAAAVAAPAEDPGVAARVAELEKALAEKSAAEEKATSRWKAAEAKTDELWRKIGEITRELEQNREAAVENARAQRQAAQVALTRAVDEASRKLVSCQDQQLRTEKERAALEREVGALKTQLEAAAQAGEQRVAQQLGELEGHLAELLTGLRQEEMRLGELEDALRVVHTHAGLIPDPVEMERELVEHAAREKSQAEALAGRDEKLAALAAELGSRDAELALLHARVAGAEQQVRAVIDAVRRTSAEIAGRSTVEISAMLDRIAAEAGESARGAEG